NRDKFPDVHHRVGVAHDISIHLLIIRDQEPPECAERIDRQPVDFEQSGALRAQSLYDLRGNAVIDEESAGPAKLDEPGGARVQDRGRMQRSLSPNNEKLMMFR